MIEQQFDPKRIGPRLAAARESAGLSVGQVAKMIAVNRHDVEAWEAGNVRIPSDTLDTLMNIYRCKLAYLLAEPVTFESEREAMTLLVGRQITDETFMQWMLVDSKVGSHE